jgi:hypothetical protein
MNSHCLDCHKEIAWQAQRDLGLHGQEKLKDCARCHPDHAGPDFELISWGRGGPEQFDHRRSGWPLEGRHAALKCRDCHKPELRKAPVAGMLQRKKPEDSWLGLERDCLSCHRDYHQETLDPDCRLCHGLTRWTPTRQFDHGKSPFALDGKHADVACEKCHLIPGRVSMTGDRGQAIPRYKPVPHRECSDCHADPHRERLGPGCAGCHVVEGFEQVDRKAFDHSKTRYPLLGRHAAVQCAECHDPDEAWGDKPPFDRCGSCHADPHAGRATLAARQVDCAACHDEQRFKPATYTVTDHQSSAYPLEGKHAAVPCDKCHPKHPSTVPSVELGLAGVLIRPAHQECGACHQDAHADQLAGRPGGSACESCHHVNGWKPSTGGVRVVPLRPARRSFRSAGRTPEVRLSGLSRRARVPPLDRRRRSAPRVRLSPGGGAPGDPLPALPRRAEAAAVLDQASEGRGLGEVPDVQGEPRAL